jgi:group I intron endonuclease
MYIYLIVNHATGKYYVGQHKGQNLQRYLQQKFNGADKYLKSRSHLFRSMRKYGRAAFSIHALLFDVQTKAELNQYEKDFIEFLRAREPEYGYNIALGGQGGGMLGHKQSSQTIEKIRASNKGKHRERLLSPAMQVKRAAAWQISLDAHDGSFHTLDTAGKIKAARATQNEAYRLQKFNEFEQAHGEERRVRAAATHRGMKHQMSAASSKAIADAARKTCEIRHSQRSLVGQRFGRLVVQAKSEKKTKFIWWDCRCDCSGTKTTTTSCLRTGNVLSCGCLAKEASRKNGRLHSLDSMLVNLRPVDCLQLS